MEVDDVETLVAKGPDRPELRGRVGRERRDRAVRRGRDGHAERGDPGVGRGAVAGRQHPGLVAQLAQGAGEAEDLHLHAAGHRQAVRADQPDAEHG